MKMRNGVGCWLLAVVFTAISGHAKEHTSHSGPGELPRIFPDGHTTREHSRLLLRVPYRLILKGEHPHVYIGIQNLSDNPIILSESFSIEPENQVYYQARSDLTGMNLTKPNYIPIWDKLVREFELFGRVILERGDFRLYDFQRLQLNVSYPILPAGAQEIRVCLLVGHNEWVFSEWVPLRRVGENLNDGEVIATVYFRNLPNHPRAIRMSEVDGIRYLFFSSTRFAMVPDGAAPRIDWQPTGALLTVYFDGVDVPPLLFNASEYQLIEWTHETAPHMEIRGEVKLELERARDALVLAPEPQNFVNPSASDDKPIPGPSKGPNALAVPFETQEKASTNPEAEPTPARHFLPVLLVFLILAGIAALVLNRNRRN